MSMAKHILQFRRLSVLIWAKGPFRTSIYSEHLAFLFPPSRQPNFTQPDFSLAGISWLKPAFADPMLSRPYSEGRDRMGSANAELLEFLS